ncbi:Ig-like domain-containing protein [Prevotellamassilia timonensis]|uniref:Ig-like domain-containing protein n=1 Tax=Prevotellamassilia timonensis TaxID=1852370 RepID=UPI00307DA0D4
MKQTITLLLAMFVCAFTFAQQTSLTVDNQTMGVLQHVTNVRLNTHSHNMNTGEEFQLQCAVTPANADNKDVIWSSSNDEIASVDQSGKVRALERGQVKIVATSKDNNSISDVCELTITQLATAIEIDRHEVRLAIGKHITLYADVSPRDVNKNRVEWEYSNYYVAGEIGFNYDDGSTTAEGRHKGTVKIIAKTCDGSNLSDTCEMTVWQPVTSVSLDKHECSMKIGETTTLRTSILPNDADNKDLVWRSSNESVATVENGVVTAHASGKARVRVTPADGSDHFDDCEITVFQPVIGVNVEPRTLTLKSIGATKQLTADVLPENADNRNVKWSSVNTSVCFVMDNGTVVAVSEGSSVVTATTVDGGFTDFCVVIVKLPVDDKRPVTGIRLEQNSVTLSKIGETVKLKATVLPADADNPNIQWESSDRTVCLVINDGTVVAIGAGSAIITATTEDGGFSAQCVVVVKSAPTAITETSRDVIVVKAENHYICVEGMSKDDKLQIFSADGTNVYSGKVSRVHVEAGVYLVKIGNEIVKVIVK